MRKIHKGRVPSNSQHIPGLSQTTGGTIRFSFKYLDLHSNPKFSASRCGDGYVGKLLERLKSLSELKYSEFVASRSPSLKIHSIDWNRTFEPGGFALSEELRGIQAWQFEITRNAHGRVHGFLTAEVFFIVWIDPDHLLYP